MMLYIDTYMSIYIYIYNIYIKFIYILCIHMGRVARVYSLFSPKIGIQTIFSSDII